MTPDFVVGEQEAQHFAELIEAYKKHQLIPYVGAGFSMHPSDNSACPSWGCFLKTLFKNFKAEMSPANKTDFKRYFKADNYEMALDVLVEVLTKNTFFEQVERIFDKPKHDDMPEGFAEKFGLFHRVFKGPWLSTNLDRFIEHTYPKSAAGITTINGFTDKRLISDLGRGDLDGYLFKLHGDAKDKNAMVFAHDQYVTAYGDDDGFDINEPLPKAFARLFSNNSLLFVGCSLTIDRPLKILLSLNLNNDDGVKPQFAVLRRRDWSGKNKLGRSKRRQLRELNIKPIYVDEFEQINEVFECLLQARGEKIVLDEQHVNLPIDELEEPDIFVGRESQLKTLIDSIGNSFSEAGSVLAITEHKSKLHNLIGHGGIGKTTLARQVMLQCGDKFDGCFEIRIDSDGPTKFAKALAGKLGDSTAEFNDDEQAKSFIERALNEHKLLLLLDNVDDGKVLLELLPKQYNSCIIVTSRDTELSRLLKLKRKQLNHCAIELDKFTEHEALALFKQLLDDDYHTNDEATYLAIAEKVDYLPIALRLAITTMVFGDQLTASELLKQLKTNQHLLLDQAASELDINSQERSILAVFDLSTPLLTDELNYCLALIAVCEQGPVPEDFLWALHQQIASEEDLDFSFDESEFIKQLRKLVRYSWCKRSTRDDVHYYELHQIVRAVVTSELIESKLRSQNIEAWFVATVHNNFIVKPLHFSVLDRWIEQTDKAVLWLKENRNELLISWVEAGFGQLCIKRGYGERFIQYCEWLRQVFVDKKTDIAMSYAHQALVLSSKGQLDDAMELHKKELKIKSELGNKLGLGRTYGNQAVILTELGQLDEAMELHKQEQQICEELGDKTGLSRTYGNQAALLQAKGQLDDAMALHKQAQKICEALGNEQWLSVCLGNQALILEQQGQLDEAMALHKKEQEMCEALGDKGGLARCLWNQGLIFELREDFKQANSLMEQAIELKRSCGMPVEKNEKILQRLIDR